MTDAPHPIGQMGIDLAPTGRDFTVLTMPPGFEIRDGDRVVIAGEPRSVIRHVRHVGTIGSSGGQATLSIYVRPSRGYRKHLRRRKAARSRRAM